MHLSISQWPKLHEILRFVLQLSEHSTSHVHWQHPSHAAKLGDQKPSQVAPHTGVQFWLDDLGVQFLVIFVMGTLQ